MNQHTITLTGFDKITERLEDYAVTMQGKEKCRKLVPFLSERELYRSLKQTTQAREFLDVNGTPPVPAMVHMEEFLDKTTRSELLLPEEMEEIGMFLSALRRLKHYLEQGQIRQNPLAFYSENLSEHAELEEKIRQSIRSGQVDEHATKLLEEITRKIQETEEKVREKAENALKQNKAFTADSFVVTRSGHICIPVKKQYRNQVAGSVVDVSGTGTTVFIEPKSVQKLCQELEYLKFDKEEEERRILYTLMAEIAGQEVFLRADIEQIIRLDFAFAKGKMSLDMYGIEPEINTERRIQLVGARHPQLDQAQCVPLDFVMDHGIRGVVITGPNTGGKTVTIKTVALLSMMGCAGLHVPAEKADIAMNAQILCDIGDGQNLQDNLSTFSAHICQVLKILKKVNRETLVILDELGSGTDPMEGMGIAIAILEELRKSGALFLVTTHYPEVKHFADRYPEIENASMAFDRDSLRPLYRLELGKAGDSCALYIAKQLGFPAGMLKMAAEAAYADKAKEMIKALSLEEQRERIAKEPSPRIEKMKKNQSAGKRVLEYQRGDSVEVCPEGKIGIVVEPANQDGDVLVQIQKEKQLISHKRLKLKVAALELYPEDYDFSIIFDSVKVRKARHEMSRKYVVDTLEL